ncbi:nucleoside hydrolase-like [Linepithema humile]|uniref:nucleoside hydrolase-like n=1 Tax=Linepithema humile TaxID=83485 RepID=UPI00351F35D2
MAVIYSIYIIIILLYLCSLVTRHCNTAPTKMIIDTDAGGDDALAIMLALMREAKTHDIEVLAITCTYGNTYVENVIQNVLKTLTIANRSDIPVYRGSDKPLINNYEPSDYYGTNGFGDFDFSRNITAKLNTTQNASALLVDLVKQYPDEIVIVSLGPLTNVARAIMLESRFLYFVKQHVIMGASINLDSEFNFKQDPEGNLIAFNDTNKPSLVIPKEAVHSVSISKEEYRDLFASLNQSIASFLYQAEKLGVEKAEYWEPSDGIAMAIALQPEITTESIETNLKPIIMGDRRGAVEIDSTKKHNAKVVKNYNVTAFKNLILEYLS